MIARVEIAFFGLYSVIFTVVILVLPPVKECVCYSLCGEGISLALDKFSSVVSC